jgi:hypothetical protein
MTTAAYTALCRLDRDDNHECRLTAGTSEAGGFGGSIHPMSTQGPQTRTRYVRILTALVTLALITAGVVVLFQGRDEASGLTLIVVGIASYPFGSRLATPRES